MTSSNIQAGRVIHTGQAIVDLVMQVDRFPEAGGDVFATHHSLLAGGGTNVMVAARRTGADVVYAGAHGTGPFGDVVRRALTADGVRLANPVSTDGDTGFCVAVTDADAERTFLSTWGVEARVRLDDLQRAEVSESDVVYVSGYSGMHTENAAAIAAILPTLPQRARVVVDPAPVVGDVPIEFLRALAVRTNIWSLNQREATTLAVRLKLSLERDDDAALCEGLASALQSTVVLRVGARGCFVASNGERATHFPAPQVNAIDTNGAGDAHLGVMCARLCLGQPLDEAIRWANAAAALAVTQFGPATCPSEDKIVAHLDPHD